VKFLKKLVITNNSLVYEKFKEKMDIIYLNEFNYLDILKYARDKIHIGHRLLTHPLSGSVKPNETPYKSLAISIEKNEIDFESLNIIEESIVTAEKFILNNKTPKWTDEILSDFRLIDYYLISGAIESMDQFY